MIVRFALILGALLAAFAGPAAAQRVNSLPVATPWLGLPQVDAVLNGRARARLIVDTAASGTVLSDAMIERLGLRPSGERAEIIGATGRTEIRHYRLSRLELGRRSYAMVPAYGFPELAAPIEADGLLGADILRRHVVEFDFPGRRLRLFDSVTQFGRWGGWSAVPLFERSDGLVLVEVTIGRLTLPALLDTGAAQNIVNPAAARALGLAILPDSESRAPVTGASGHVLDMNRMTISRLSIGDVAFHDTRLGVADLSIFETLGLGDGPAMLLSAEILSDRRFVIDYPRNRLLIETPGTPPPG